MMNKIIKTKYDKRKEDTCVFEMNKSNVKFIELGNGVMTNKPEIIIEEEMKIEEENRELICIGNNTNETMKIQISKKEDNYKYLIRTEPNVVMINKGQSCEIEIFIKPKCTCEIEEYIAIISKDIKRGDKENVNNIKIKGRVELSTKLDQDEIIEEKKIGEGSFGIVYIGTFRGNRVAIKKMKETENDEKGMEEFEKEVSMLDKFRSEYIIHFYGASFIPNKICMVTEYAEYGSLQELMNRRKDNPINKKLRIKILLDASKGIEYLHSNGILHRDIKPDNILITTLEEKSQVNGKLTDFGSSRNINILMTNMTFTKGIGTPKYMAPEILNESKYKKSADIFSFSITMYECINWNECYPKKEFKHPWEIANYIVKGNRRPKGENMTTKEYQIIEDSWAQESKKRSKIEDIIKQLEELKEN